MATRRVAHWKVVIAVGLAIALLSGARALYNGSETWLLETVLGGVAGVVASILFRRDIRIDRTVPDDDKGSKST